MFVLDEYDEGVREMVYNLCMVRKVSYYLAHMSVRDLLGRLQ